MAEFILQRPNEVLDLSIADLSQQAGVSQPTVARFASAMGFSGYKEFKLRLEKEKAVDLAGINIQRDIAQAQASVMGEAMKAAKIEIIGGEGKFFDQIAGAISRGKSVDRMVANSEVLGDVKDTFFNGDPDYFKAQLKEWAGQFGVTAEDVKNLTVSGVLGKLLVDATGDTRRKLLSFLGTADRFGLADEKASKVIQ